MAFKLPAKPARLPRRPRFRGLAGLALPTREDAIPLAVLTLAYTAAAAMGLQWTVVRGVGAVIWPAAGVALAGLMLGGVRLWPAVFLGRLLAAGVAGAPLPWYAITLIAAGGALAAAAPALVLQRRGGFDPMLTNLRDLGGLWVAGAGFGAVISAFSGVLALATVGATPAELGKAAATWSFGFAAGVVTIGPLVLAWSPKAARRQTPASWVHFGICMAANAVAVGMIFLQPMGELRTWHIFPLLIWAAIAFNARGISLIMTMIALAGIWAAARGMGPLSDAPGAVQESVLLTHQFVLITAATMFVLAAVADQRRGKQKLEEAAMTNARLYAAAQREIAERRRAEDHQRLLINELNHRVKNTLATVQSVASQTLRTAKTPEAALDGLTSRIMSLARAHDVLTKENWAGADLHAVLQVALDPFGGADGRRVYLEGPVVRLTPGEALAMAMAFHELATNALKYGALSSPEGAVDVSWRQEAAGGLRRLHLDWVERGGPRVQAPRAQGFGLKLLQRALPAQLHGKVELAFEPAGLSCRIDAALSEAPAAGEMG